MRPGECAREPEQWLAHLATGARESCGDFCLLIPMPSVWAR